jgi:hypothetical protein
VSKSFPVDTFAHSPQCSWGFLSIAEKIM